MAEKENCPEIFSSIQENPDGSVSMNEKPTANSIVQALVTDQSALAAISEAILSAIKPVLTEHDAPANTSQAVAEPVGPLTNKPTEESVGQTVQGTKRNISDTIDLTANEEHASRKRSHVDLNGKDSSDTLLDVDQGNGDGNFNTSSHCKASEELDAFLSVILKPMPRFDRRAISREFPRPTSMAAFTPNLDSYLPSMISGAKVTDNNLRETQDKILDILGPLCTMYENLNFVYESQSKVLCKESHPLGR